MSDATITYEAVQIFPDVLVGVTACPVMVTVGVVIVSEAVNVSVIVSPTLANPEFELPVVTVVDKSVGGTVSQVKLKVEEFELPALSVAVNLITYAPSNEAETVVETAPGVPKVITPGPDTAVQEYVAIPELGAGSVTVPV